MGAGSGCDCQWNISELLRRGPITQASPSISVTSMLIIHPSHLHFGFCMCQWPQASSPSSSSSCLLFKTCSSRCTFLYPALPASYGIFKTFFKIFSLQLWVGSVFGICLFYLCRGVRFFTLGGSFCFCLLCCMLLCTCSVWLTQGGSVECGCVSHC